MKRRGIQEKGKNIYVDKEEDVERGKEKAKNKKEK